MKSLSQLIENLNNRERLFLGVGLLVTVVIFVYTLALEPWYRELARLRSDVPQKEADLAWMQNHVVLATRLRTRNLNTHNGSSASLLSVVETTASAAKVPIRQIDPGGDGEVKIWFKETDFDPWLIWLESLRKRGIEATNVSVDRTADNKASVRLTVRSGG